MCVTTFIQSVMFQKLFYHSSVLGIRVRATLIAAIYRKSLLLAPSTSHRCTAGQIVNLVAVDIQRLQDFLSYCWVLWSAPLQISLAMLLLYRELGASAFLGLLVMILTMVLNVWLTKLIRRFSVFDIRFPNAPAPPLPLPFAHTLQSLVCTSHHSLCKLLFLSFANRLKEIWGYSAKIFMML